MLKIIFDKYIFNFKGIMISSLILSGIMFVLILFQPVITDSMLEFYGHVPKINKKEDVKVRNSTPQRVIPISTKNIKNTILIARIDSLEKRISQIETEGAEPDLSAYRGTFGDMYGSLNSLFSGIGIVGVVVTVLIQILIHKREIDSEKEKIATSHINKLIYLISIYGRILQSNNSFIKTVENWLIKHPNETITFDTVEVETTVDSLNLAVNKIDHENLFQAYSVFAVDFRILESFEIVDNLLEIRTQMNKEFAISNGINNECLKNIYERHTKVMKILLSDSIINFSSLDDLFNTYKNLKERTPGFRFENPEPHIALELDGHIDYILNEFQKLLENLNYYKSCIKESNSNLRISNQNFNEVYLHIVNIVNNNRKQINK